MQQVSWANYFILRSKLRHVLYVLPIHTQAFSIELALQKVAQQAQL